MSKKQSDLMFLEDQLETAMEKFQAEGGDLKEVANALKQESSLYFDRSWRVPDLVANLLYELRGLGELENLARRFREDEEVKEYYLPDLLAEYAPASLE